MEGGYRASNRRFAALILEVVGASAWIMIFACFRRRLIVFHPQLYFSGSVSV